MASRDLDDLQPTFRDRVVALLADAEEQGLDLLVYCTRRTFAQQARLFRRGRKLSEIKAKAAELTRRWGRADLGDLLMDVGPQTGRLVTWAGPGQSLHNYGLAVDAVPRRDGDLVWTATDPDDLALWRHYGRLAAAHGLVWGGNWSTPDRPHVQTTLDWRDLLGGAA